MGRPRPYPSTLDQAGNKKIVNYGQKRFITLGPGAYPRVFSHNNPFQSCQVKPLQGAPLWVGSAALPANTRLDWKQKILNYGQKSFITLGPGAYPRVFSQYNPFQSSQVKPLQGAPLWVGSGLTRKHQIRLETKKQLITDKKSLITLGPGAYPRVFSHKNPFQSSLVKFQVLYSWQAPALPANTRLGWKQKNIDLRTKKLYNIGCRKKLDWTDPIKSITE